MKITRLFSGLIFSNCKSLRVIRHCFFLHYLLYEITSFSGSGARRQFESLLTLGNSKNNNNKRESKEKMWQLFSSYIKMELSYGLKMQRKWVTLIETSVIVTIWLIVFVFSPLKTFSLLFSKPFLPFLFQNSWDFFAHLQNQYQFRFLFWCWTNLASSLRKEASSHQTSKWRWPNTWGKWGWYPWLINDKECQACLVLDHWQTEPHQNLEAIDEVMGKQVNFTFDQREITWDRI